MASTSTQSILSPFASRPLLRSLAENWWMLLIRGIAAIGFGVLAFIWPGITLLTLVLFWGAYALVDGVFALWAAFKGTGGVLRWWLIVVGIAGIASGVLTFVWPNITAQVLLLFIAAWAIVVGVMQIWGAIQLRKEMEGEWLLILSGLLSVAFGVVMIWRPEAGALAVIWMIGVYAILIGCNYIALAFRLKKHKPA